MVAIRYLVDDVDASVTFYTQLLGFELIEQFGRDDLAALVERLRESGVAFRNDIVSGPGGKQILCEDPSGNVVELFQAL